MTPLEKQIEFSEQMRRKVGLNLVSCNCCGAVLFHKQHTIDEEEETVDCPFCEATVLPNDCEDLYYVGMYES